MSRLVYRKGIDLLVAAAPQICDLYPQVRFIVGGDGPKMVELEQMREKYQLQDRIELLGSIPPSGVRDVSAGTCLGHSPGWPSSFGAGGPDADA
jgi:phosphatidylinositol glycan class A protein